MTMTCASANPRPQNRNTDKSDILSRFRRNIMDRNLDGIYFRVQRDGKWGNVCFSDLTQEEMERVMENRDVDWLKSMCIQLGKTIRRIGDELDIVCE